jgi:hypothetical protein
MPVFKSSGTAERPAWYTTSCQTGANAAPEVHSMTPAELLTVRSARVYTAPPTGVTLVRETMGVSLTTSPVAPPLTRSVVATDVSGPVFSAIAASAESMNVWSSVS